MSNKIEEYINEAFKKANEIRAERGKGYNAQSSPLDYFPHGLQDMFYEVNKKMLRAENANIALCQGKEIDEDKLEDNIVDSINYLGFAYAYIKQRGEK